MYDITLHDIVPGNSLAPTQDVDMVFPTESMIQLSQELQVIHMQRARMTG